MDRDLARLSRKRYDVLIVGGGVYGLCTAWDAALRGLSVALIEKGDFGHATSFNSLRLIHGGLRYLRNAHLRRARLSIRETVAWMRIAPHLIHPVPFLVPTYGHGLRGRELLALGLWTHGILGLDLRAPESREKPPRGRVLSRSECLRLLPDVQRAGLTGGVIYYDCQMYSSERLILSLARSGNDAGADLANYVEAIRFLKEGDGVTGVTALDLLTGNEFDIRAKIIVNCAGPWLEKVQGLCNGRPTSPRMHFFKGINLVINRLVVKQYGVGVRCEDRFSDGGATLRRTWRMFFIVPGHDFSLIGTAHFPCHSGPERVRVSEHEIQQFLDQINEAHPAANLKPRDIRFVHAGLVPRKPKPYASDVIQAKTSYQIIDHFKAEGIAGLISVAGVKFTEARHVAEKTVNLVFGKLGRTPPTCASGTTPLYGGRIERFGDLLNEGIRNRPPGLDEAMMRGLISRYGAAYPDVLRYLKGSCEPSQISADRFRLMKAEVLHGIREEMARRLSDVVLRRLALGVSRTLEDQDIKSCADIISQELNWSTERTVEEIRETKAFFPSYSEGSEAKACRAKVGS